MAARWTLARVGRPTGWRHATSARTLGLRLVGPLAASSVRELVSRPARERAAGGRAGGRAAECARTASAKAAFNLNWRLEARVAGRTQELRAHLADTCCWERASERAGSSSASWEWRKKEPRRKVGSETGATCA